MAIAVYKLAIAIAPREGVSYQLLAEAYKAQGDIEAELGTWRNLLAVSGGSKAYLKGLLDALWRVKRTDELLQQLDEFMRANPNDSELQLMKASYQWHKGNVEAAAETLRSAAGEGSFGSVATLAFGNALWDLHRYDEALVEISKAVQLYPTWPDAHTQLAIKLGETGEFEKAVEHAKEGLLYGAKTRKGKQLAYIYGTLGIAYMRVGKYDASVGAFREAIRLDPDSAILRNNMADVLLKKGSLDSAHKEIQKAIALDGNNAAIRDTYAMVLEAQEQKEEAQSELRTAIRLSPEYPPAHYHLALVLLRGSQLEEGYKELERFLQVAPVLGRYKKTIEDAQSRLAKGREDGR